MEEANYEAGMAALDELRDKSLSRRFEMGENAAESTGKHSINGMIVYPMRHWKVGCRWIGNF